MEHEVKDFPTTEQWARIKRAQASMRVALWAHHAEHTKDTVCLNRQLTKQPWTYVPGERSVVLSRFIQPPRQGRFSTRRVRL
jgi:hypothetical protein